MFTGIKNKILKISRAYGVEISITSTSDPVFQVVAVTLDKNKVIKEREVNKLTSLEELAKAIPAGSPVAVTISGKGVLYKEIGEIISPEVVFETVLPNANPNDFYTTITDFKRFAAVCIVRRAMADNLLNTLASIKLRILNVSIGPGDCQYVIPYLNTDKEEQTINSNHYAIHLGLHKNISSINTISLSSDEIYPKTEYSIGDQYVFSSGLIAFGSAMGLLAGTAFEDPEIKMDVVKAAREDYSYSKYYKAARLIFATFIFALLLINFFVYNYYFNKNAQQFVSHALSANELKEQQKRESSVVSKETFISRFGWDRPSRISFSADRIAGLVPEDAQLTGLRINPVNTGFIGENNLQLFKQDTIQISGACADPTELNRFANNLRNITMFKQVDLKSYAYKKESQNGIFLLEITTK